MGDALEWLAEHGLPIQPAWRRCASLAEAEAFIAEWQERRFSLPYVTDGAVVKLDDLTLWDGLGATVYAPCWAVVYKYPPEEARTRILSIDVSVGRTGALTPVANLVSGSRPGGRRRRTTRRLARVGALERRARRLGRLLRRRDGRTTSEGRPTRHDARPSKKSARGNALRPPYRPSRPRARHSNRHGTLYLEGDMQLIVSTVPANKPAA